MIISVDVNRRITEFNRAAERAFGYSKAEVLGKPVDLLYADPDEGRRVHLSPLPDGGFTGEIKNRRKNGETFDVYVSASVMRDAAGRMVGLMGISRDITARKRAEAELRASRARIVEAADEARRRLERDLHDGAQARLVNLGLVLRLARARLERHEEAGALLDEAINELAEATNELREFARGVHPAVLTEGGLAPALRALAQRAPFPVRLGELPTARLPQRIEATVYFLVAEALTNIARYSGTDTAEIELQLQDGCVTIAVHDRGRGGADPAVGSGLRGLADRVAALDGSFEVKSEGGRGTTIRAAIPCA
jgi:PAS domain S-box-containing protein